MYKYIGDGAALIGVPARDLTDEEAKQYGERELVKSGLYRKEKEKIVKPKKDDEE